MKNEAIVAYPIPCMLTCVCLAIVSNETMRSFHVYMRLARGFPGIQILYELRGGQMRTVNVAQLLSL